MTHRFPVKEIARQSGLGTATVDRVLNNRAHVSPQTRARVNAAMAELELQEQQLAARGRRMFVDVLVEAPARFSRQIKSACETVLPGIQQAVFRPRFEMHEQLSDTGIVAALDRIGKRGSQGIVLKARDVPPVQDAVNRLENAGIPVVTLVTDVPGSQRSAYVGLDNATAGQTAAYLLANMLGDTTGTILTSLSQDAFQGEATRYAAFEQVFRHLRPGFEILTFSGGAGVTRATTRALRDQIAGQGPIAAVYSMGGGNRAILDVLDHAGQRPEHFIAHDLDADNVDLLRNGALSFVLHHDLTVDMRHAFAVIAGRHGLAPASPGTLNSEIQVITPYNIPE
ncbi:LacI family DNA-binding transcriptional regulator [Shimia abyssi]|uniref:LacI family transcriptional regulator n=1 Tax=Shimia abyssi TaxID=1662395 RepID=A0A2P8FBY3_9RHOB|nr:LacI family DNA-binding transcriptional regulator [Shimia abyssi]PSL19182.1 LacI family transcriptional regulator [Shimia abyssi]